MKHLRNLSVHLVYASVETRKLLFLSGFSFINIHDSQLEEAISLPPLYHFHPLHRQLDISWAITADNSPLHIASSRNWTGAQVANS